jgi:hypothetical protein
MGTHMTVKAGRASIGRIREELGEKYFHRTLKEAGWKWTPQIVFYDNGYIKINGNMLDGTNDYTAVTQHLMMLLHEIAAKLDDRRQDRGA